MHILYLVTLVTVLLAKLSCLRIILCNIGDVFREYLSIFIEKHVNVAHQNTERLQQRTNGYQPNNRTVTTGL